MSKNITIIPPSEGRPDILRVAAYCRVSTDMEEQESSYASQIRSYTELISQHEGWELVDIYNAGIYVPKNATLVITAESTSTLDVSSSADAGIGGGTYDPSDPTGNTSGDPNCGTVVINGGTITATGGTGCAGIGGGLDADLINPGNGGNVTISGRTVTATGGSDSGGNYGGAGIGGGSNGNEFGNGGTLTISGGHVTLAPGAHNTQWGTAYGFGRGSCTPNASTGTCELTLADASYLAEGTTLDPNGKYTIKHSEALRRHIRRNLYC